MAEDRQTLAAQLGVVDVNLGFLFLIILSVLFSFRALSRERDAVYLLMNGEEEQAERAGDVRSLRVGASALAVGCLGFFFQQSLEICQNADPSDPAAGRTARLDVIGGFLTLLAALIRLLELNLAGQDLTSRGEELLPA